MDMEDKERLRRILNDPDLKKQSESAAAGKRKHTIGIRIKGGGRAMTDRMEEIIRASEKKDWYDYYLSLGYSSRVSFVLALFEYGNHRFRNLTIDSIYDSLMRGEPYVPEEYRETLHLPDSWTSAPAGSKGRARKMAASAPMPEVKAAACAPAGPISLEEGGSIESGSIERQLAEAMFDESETFARAARPSAPRCCIADTSISEKASFATDEYEPVEEKDPVSVLHGQTSTFRMTTNTASAGIVLNQLRNGRRIDQSMVRIEEMLNYFRYSTPMPGEETFGISLEAADAGERRKYLYINVQGMERVPEKQNIVILLDVSGSMSSNSQYTQGIVATILSKLKEGDRLSLITYSSRDQIILNGMEIRGEEDRIHALEKFLSLKISGFTYGSAGIETAYKIGRSHYISGGNNQVILITDGDLNFGITDKGGLEELIEEKKKDRLFLSVIGTGLWNYKDDKLEILSKHGNGVYRTVNSLSDVRKSIFEEYASLVNIIAKDVKAQVEFNPETVESYRLLGFENRTLSHEDFSNDKVISEPFGSGGYGVALYELTMREKGTAIESGYKYSRIVTTGSEETGTVRVRYKEPLGEVSSLQEKVIGPDLNSFSDNLRLAFIVYVCSEKLRDSDKISENEIAMAKKFYGELGEEIRRINEADLYKLAGILDMSKRELGIGIRSKRPFKW